MELDLKQFVLGFDALWNTGQRDAILAAVDGQSVVELVPAPPPPARPRYTGPAEIAVFIDTFLPGFHVDSSSFRREGDELVWESSIRNDVFRSLGLETARGTTRARLGDGGRLRHFSFSLDGDTVSRLAASSAVTR
jgi:hypothetical protein